MTEGKEPFYKTAVSGNKHRNVHYKNQKKKLEHLTVSKEKFVRRAIKGDIHKGGDKGTILTFFWYMFNFLIFYCDLIFILFLFFPFPFCEVSLKLSFQTDFVLTCARKPTDTTFPELVFFFLFSKYLESKIMWYLRAHG